MDADFWLKLAVSFIVGAVWISVTTLSAERFGSKVGGLIGGLPSTVVIALLFIGLTQSAQAAAQATTVMPLAQGLNGLFVIAFMLLIPRNLGLALGGSLLLWLIDATLLYLANIQQFWISVVGWLVLLVICVWVVERWMKIQSVGGARVIPTTGQIILRAVFGGAVIGTAVLVGKLGGPLLGGIFASFPAMFLTTLVITFRASGVSFCRAVGKSLLVSGLVNVPLYEIAVRYLYPQVGLGLGTTLALLFSLFTGYITYQVMKSRLA